MSVLSHESRKEPASFFVPDAAFKPLGALARECRIGGVLLPGRVFCAPMAGYTDRPFRKLAKRFGAALLTTEMISARALLMERKKSLKLMEFEEQERPLCVQLFGSDPLVMGEAAAITMNAVRPDLLDVNFGCPVEKVLKSDSGAAVLKDPAKAGRIVKAMIEATRGQVPVTVKTRAGFDRIDGSALEMLRACEEAGASAFTLHGRTRKQMYGGLANWDVIAQIKASAKIPVIGNGDVKTPADAGRMFRETGCDAVMVGRATYGAPWIFRQMNEYLETGVIPAPLSLRFKLSIALEHYEDAIRLQGEKLGVLEMRKHLTHYVKGFVGARELRQIMLVMADPAKVCAKLREVIETLPEDAR